MGQPPGAQLGPYKIIAPLGRGGMGEVYLAEDTVLQRRVAIKLLLANEPTSETARRRLLNEARAAARLEHPHICPVFEVGEDGDTPFIVMPFIEGETLAARLGRSRLSAETASDIAVQIVSALQEAHARGVIHRDIKPQNIMITGHGHVKLMDFGLAKLTERAATIVTGAETAPQLTAPHAITGTATYMSPEQARGEPLDARTDLFSLGSTLFEAVSGRPPFLEGSVADTLAAILLKPPPPLRTLVDVPKPFERIVHRCLEKDRAQRYQTSADLLADLQAVRAGGSSVVPMPTRRTARRQWLALAGAGVGVAAVALAYLTLPMPPARVDINSLAVLPFANVSGSADADYLGDGIAEGLINTLARVPTLKVMSRSLAFQQRGREADVQGVARVLDVDAILTGRVTTKGERVVVTAELIHGADGSLLWGDQFDRPGSEIIGVQEAIARGVSGRLRPQLSVQDQALVNRRDTDDAEAYRLYLRGRYHWSKLSPEGWLKGTDYFQQAIDRDAAYARAYAGLADCYNLRGIFGLQPAREAFPRAKQAAVRALDIEPTLAEAHTSLGVVAFYYDWNWEAADRALRQAIEFGPDYAYAHNFLGIFLGAMGRFDEGLVASRRAEELDPLSTLNATNVGLVLYFARRFDEAVAQFRRALELDAGYFTAHFWLGNALAARGRFKEALAELEQARTLSGGQPIVLASLAHVHSRAGERASARQMLEELRAAATRQHVPAYFVALVHHSLGDNDEAFRSLDQAFEERSGWMARLKVEPWMDGLRSDPRFAALLRRVSRSW